MERSLRWKTLFLVFLIVLSVVYLLPSVVPAEKLPPWFAKIFSKKVKLGLDLEGGQRIVYGLALDRAIEDKAATLKRDVETKLKELNLEGQVDTPPSRPDQGVPVGAVFITAKTPEAAKTVAGSKFRDDYAGQLDKLNCPSGRNPNTVCYKVSSEYAEKIRSQAVEQAVKIIADRVDQYGVAEPTIIRKGDDVIVELPGQDEKEHERLRSIINQTAQLTFKMVDDGTPFMTKLAQRANSDADAKAKGITGSGDGWTHDDSGEQHQDNYLRAEDEIVVLTPEEGKAKKYSCKDEPNSDGKVECTATGRDKIQEWLKNQPAEFQPDDQHEIGFELVEPRDASDPDLKKYWRTYLLKRTVELGGTEVTSADVFWDSTTNRPEVLVTFNRYGARRFGDLTSANKGRKMAIVLDERIRSAPVIQGAITGGRCTITMGGGDPAAIQSEAQDLVSVLRTGALPAPLEEKYMSKVGAMLGQDAIDRAKLSMIVGAIAVILLMLWFYRLSGALANLAMVLNILFQMAILAAFQATLTLPGIAGLVLTIGMAVDSNIIIYERIREELRAGKSVRGAVDAGFSRAFWTVFDAHVTNFVAGFVLMEYGSGPIRGFAVMLLIGVVCNLFTSTWCSRLLFEYYLRRKKTATTLSI
jgi:preprotein translocase subunit SecD